MCITQSLRDAAALVGVAGAVTAASSNHSGYWNSGLDFYVRINYMTDFDQSRAAGPGVLGLPNNGNMYCVPASCANLFAYIERHGFENEPGVIGPGVEAWADAADLVAYNTAGLYIGVLGNSMNTTPSGGTSEWSDIEAAVDARLPDDLFDVNTYLRNEFWMPRTIHLAYHMSQGGIVTFIWGRYDIDRSAPIPQVVARSGGHAVTLTKVDKRASMSFAANEYVINTADPSAGGGSLLNQSAFSYDAYSVFDEMIIPDGGSIPIRHSVYDVTRSDGLEQIIDGSMAIFPKGAWGVWPQQNQMSLWTGSFSLGGEDGTGPSRQTFTTPDGRNIVDTALSPERSFGVVLTENDPASGSPGTLSGIELATGNTYEIDTVGTDEAALTFGRDLTLYVATAAHGSRLTGIRAHKPLSVAPDGPPRPPAPTDLDLPATSIIDIAYDDTSDSVIVLAEPSPPVRGTEPMPYILIVMKADIAAIETIISVPGGIFTNAPDSLDVFPGSGDMLITEHDTGRVVIAEGVDKHFSGTDALRVMSTDTLGGPLVGVSPIGANTIGVNTSGTTQPSFTVYDRTPTGLQVSQSPPPIADARFLRDFEFTQSRNNIDPAIHSGPEWDNLVPADLIPPAESTIDCIADLVEPFEELDHADLAEFLSLFAAQSLRAELTGEGAWDWFDLAAYFDLLASGCR